MGEGIVILPQEDWLECHQNRQQQQQQHKQQQQQQQYQNKQQLFSIISYSAKQSLLTVVVSIVLFQGMTKHLR